MFKNIKSFETKNAGEWMEPLLSLVQKHGQKKVSLMLMAMDSFATSTWHTYPFILQRPKAESKKKNDASNIQKPK